MRVWPCEMVTMEKPKGSSADERNSGVPGHRTERGMSTRQDDRKRARSFGDRVVHYRTALAGPSLGYAVNAAVSIHRRMRKVTEVVGRSV